MWVKAGARAGHEGRVMGTDARAPEVASAPGAVTRRPLGQDPPRAPTAADPF